MKQNTTNHKILQGQNPMMAWLLLLILALIWGSSFILMKKSMLASDGGVILSWDQVAALRIFLAGAALLPISIYRLRNIERPNLAWMLFVGLVGNTIPAFLFTSSQMHVDSGFAGMLNSLTPLFTLLLGIFLFRQPSRMLQIIGVLVALAGTAGLIIIQTGIEGTGSMIHAMGIVVATICYGLSVNVMRSKLRGVRSEVIAAIALLFAAIPTGIYLFFTPLGEVIRFHPSGWEAVGYVSILGVIGTALALVLFNKLITLVGAVFASSVTYLIPFVALGWAVLDGEEVVWMHFILLAVMITGIYLINKGRPEAAEK